MLIGIVDEQHLMAPPPFVRSTAPSSTGSNAVAVPSISPLSRFADLLFHSPAIASLVSNSPVVEQQPPCETSSPTPERAKTPSQANAEPSSVSPSAAESWSPLRKTFPAKGASPTPSSKPEPAWMEMDEQTTPGSPVDLDAVDESLPTPMTGDSEDVSMVTSSSEPPPTSATSTRIRNPFLSLLPVISSVEPTIPVALTPRPNLLHAHPMAQLPSRPAVPPPPPLTGRGTPAGQGRRRASPVFPSSQAISPSVFMVAPSSTRLKPPMAPRSMNVATGPLTPPLSSLNPNCVAPKPVYKSPPKGPRALMESLPGPRNSSGSCIAVATDGGGAQYIPRGPSATRDLERWPNTTKDLDRVMETRDRDRDRERERERERDRDRDERERYGDRDRKRDRDYESRHYCGGMRKPPWKSYGC